ncbi:uncharacterized protein EV422DRAFT_599328 [Fimicolochytrium jonesii]|uniref:uncharacterized protein n=1 Tax=Fimicolochytrium jonesii TaxID=1396493 RepID=UPI0022FE57C0|nr:uncharacterized protein EV422DRAFT_599328 [Fimicolochytrium jonesii]KAI8818890.1 hypothetical protein EV422DRAFT_599328 [Fimicolochytrium jonesii]
MTPSLSRVALPILAMKTSLEVWAALKCGPAFLLPEIAREGSADVNSTDESQEDQDGEADDNDDNDDDDDDDDDILQRLQAMTSDGPPHEPMSEDNDVVYVEHLEHLVFNEELWAQLLEKGSAIARNRELPGDFPQVLTTQEDVLDAKRALLTVLSPSAEHSYPLQQDLVRRWLREQAYNFLDTRLLMLSGQDRRHALKKYGILCANVESVRSRRGAKRDL